MIARRTLIGAISAAALIAGAGLAQAHDQK